MNNEASVSCSRSHGHPWWGVSSKTVDYSLWNECVQRKGWIAACMTHQKYTNQFQKSHCWTSRSHQRALSVHTLHVKLTQPLCCPFCSPLSVSGLQSADSLTPPHRPPRFAMMDSSWSYPPPPFPCPLSIAEISGEATWEEKWEKPGRAAEV